MYQLLDKQQQTKLGKWVVAQDEIMLERQRISMSPQDFNHLTMNGQYPYYGASDGSLTYMITPTSLGDVVKVRHNATNEEIDLTDYDMW